MIKKISIVILITGLIAGFAWMFFANQTVPVEQENPTNVFPIGTSNPSANTQTNEVLILKTANGGVLQVKNFTLDAETIEDPHNKGTYYLGNHFPFDDTPTEQPEYVITYTPSTQYFNVVLSSEPINRARINAEQYLLTHLGVSEEQLCQIDYMVSVPYFVNQFYTSQDLRFSFCPGSIPL